MSPRATTFRLRTALPEDFESLYEIDQLCYEPLIAYSRHELRAYLKYPAAECIVAQTRSEHSKAPGKIVGFCITTAQEDFGYIITIDVLEPWRRAGAGSALLGEAEKRLAARGIREVGLDTATDNTSAIAFWKKHGYLTEGVRKRYYPNGRDAFAMIKTLA